MAGEEQRHEAQRAHGLPGAASRETGWEDATHDAGWGGGGTACLTSSTSGKSTASSL